MSEQTEQNEAQQGPPKQRTPDEIRRQNAIWTAGYDAAKRDQGWVGLTEVRQLLSRALGEIDAAHVDLDRQGVTRCEGESLQDRIARFGDTAQSQAEEKDAEIARVHALSPYWWGLTERAEDAEAEVARLLAKLNKVTEERATIRDMHEAAEARATAAELERDQTVVSFTEAADTVQRLTARAEAAEQERDLNREMSAAIADQHMARAVALDEARAKLAAAEQREAEKDKALRRIAEHDGERWTWKNDVAEHKSSPQEIAQAALTTPC